MPKRPRLAFVIGLLAFAAAFEATVRLEDLIRYGTPLLADARSQSDLLMADSLGVRGRPHGRFRQWSLDSLGYRGPEVARIPPPGTVRIVAVGASETFGLLEDSGREFPRQIEDSLNALASREDGVCGSGTHYEVVNAALPGMYLPTAVQSVRGHIAGLAPDAILFYPTPHQYLDLEVPRATTGLPRPETLPDWFRPFLPRSTGRLRDAAKQVLPTPISMAIRRGEIGALLQSHPPGWEFTDIPPDRTAALDGDLRALVGAIREIGAIPILATHANRFLGTSAPADEELMLMWRRYAPRATAATILAFDSAANAVIRRVAADSSVAVVPVDSAFRASPSDSSFGDYIHFTNRGSGVVAATAAPVIARATSTPRPPCGPN